MSKKLHTLLSTAVIVLSSSAVAADVSVDVALELELRAFTAGPSVPGQYDDNVAVSLEPDFQASFNNGNSLWRLVPFGRLDSRDTERSHADIRELYLLHVMGEWEFLAGISKVFWGVAESGHLVDIINQTDYLEGLDGEDKLGQPMLRLSRSFDQGSLTLFALPWFRERTFLPADSPLSLPLAINDDPVYESREGQDHVDFAIRYNGYQDIVDYGVSWFKGTSRDAGFIPDSDGRLRPYYPQISQFGLDLQITSESWLWKFEVIRRIYDRKSAGNDFTAAVGGFEYSFYGLQDGLFDLGLLVERHYDSRDNPGTIPFQDDLFMGMRFGFTDADSTEVLAGAVIDLADDTQSFRIEGNRRMFGNARLSLEAQSFSNVDPGNVSYSLRDSDYVLLSMGWFF